MVLFTTTEYIKSICPIDTLMSDKHLFPALQQAQNIDFRNIVGDNLYAKLEAMISDGTIGKVGNEIWRAAVDNAQTLIGYLTITRLIPIISFKLSNIGVQRNSDDKITAPSFEEVMALKDYYKHQADYLTYQYQNYLLKYKDELGIDNCQCQRIKSNLRTSATSGLVLGGERGKVLRRN